LWLAYIAVSDVNDDIYEREVQGGALKLNFTSYPDQGSYGDLLLKDKIPTAELGT
jgi:hypothetical protein